MRTPDEKLPEAAEGVTDPPTSAPVVAKGLGFTVISGEVKQRDEEPTILPAKVTAAEVQAMNRAKYGRQW